jgi:hypothetical protein
MFVSAIGAEMVVTSTGTTFGVEFVVAVDWEGEAVNLAVVTILRGEVEVVEEEGDFGFGKD